MRLRAILTIAAAVLVGVSASAQNPMGMQGARQQGGRQQISAEEMANTQTQQMVESLKLTAEQQKAVHELNLANAQVAEAERQQQMQLMQQIRERQQQREELTDAAMKEILDESQYKKWLKQKQRRATNEQGGTNTGDRGGFGGGMGGPGGFGGSGGGPGGGFGGGMGF